jgi:DNA modification methylase
VWTIPTEANASDHPAPTPLELPIRCVAAGCPPGGTVLDPFSGSATTELAARRLGRNYIGIDTNPDYHIIAMQRLGMIAAGDDLSVREKSVNSTVVGEATRR